MSVEAPAAAPSHDRSVTVVDSRVRTALRPRDLLDHLDLLYFLTKKEVLVRYKQTAVGALWAVIQPVLLATVFSVFLGARANLPSGDTPYGLFALTGMTLWLFIATALAQCSQSTISNANLISKVYFPRVVIPVVAVLAPVVDFLIAFVVLIGALLVYGQTLEPKILLVPFVLAAAVTVVLGLGMWLSAVVVRYRDVGPAVSFMLLLLLFLTPILYPLDLIPEAYRTWYSLNPLVGLLETFRWTVLPGADAPGLPVLASACMGVPLVLGGFVYFQRAERRFADII